MKKILITGDYSFENKLVIKNFIFEISQKYNKKDFIIATMGNDYGVEKYVKKFTIEFGLNYGEFNPYHSNRSLYDIMPNYLFGKRYHGINFAIRDGHAVNWADFIYIFVNKSNISDNKFCINKKYLIVFQKLIKLIEKKKKKYLIVNI